MYKQGYPFRNEMVGGDNLGLKIPLEQEQNGQKKVFWILVNVLNADDVFLVAGPGRHVLLRPKMAGPKSWAM